MTRSPTSPGPWWLWMTAWTLQGAALLVVDWLGLEDHVVRFFVSGLLAAVPLVGLYLFLTLAAHGKTGGRS